MKTWQAFARRLGISVAPKELNLRFICDVADERTAYEAVGPFLSMPLLASCSIRLGRKTSIPGLQGLASTTALRAVGDFSPHYHHPFRLLDLPPEVRLRMLEYTDLVTPLRQVEWHPENGFRVRYFDNLCQDKQGHMKTRCSECRWRACSLERSFGCFCQRHHAAFSSSTRCKCWSPPVDLFLVCKSFLEGSRHIFYSANRFMVTPAASIYGTNPKKPASLEASTFFLKAVPSTALHFLRWVDLVLQPFDDQHYNASKIVYKEWLEVISLIKGRLRCANLTLRVYMAALFPITKESWPPTITPEQDSAMIQSYGKLIKPLSALEDLDTFNVYLFWPFHPTEKHSWPYWRQGRSRDSAIRKQELELERLVMGDDYDSMDFPEIFNYPFV